MAPPEVFNTSGRRVEISVSLLPVRPADSEHVTGRPRDGIGRWTTNMALVDVCLTRPEGIDTGRLHAQVLRGLRGGPVRVLCQVSCEIHRPFAGIAISPLDHADADPYVLMLERVAVARNTDPAGNALLPEI